MIADVYAYVGNDPLNLTDPLGLTSIWDQYQGQDVTNLVRQYRSPEGIAAAAAGASSMRAYSSGADLVPTAQATASFLNSYADQAKLAGGLAFTQGGPIAAAGLLVAATGYAAQVGAYILQPRPVQTMTSLAVDVVQELAPGNPVVKQAVGAIAGQVLPNAAAAQVQAQQVQAQLQGKPR